MKGGGIASLPQRINHITSGAELRRMPQYDVKSGEFAQLLRQNGETNKQLNQTVSPLVGVQFSNHAIERMSRRGIQLTPDEIDRLNYAVGKAQEKGARDTLVLMDNKAFIVSIKNKMVVTVMDKTNLKENVFTNIDSTVVV